MRSLVPTLNVPRGFAVSSERPTKKRWRSNVEPAKGTRQLVPRAFAALDLTAAADLLGRAALLLPNTDPARSDFIPELAVSLMEVGRVTDAERLLHETAASLGPEAVVQQARIELQLIAAKGVYQHASDEEVVDLIDQTQRIVTRLQGEDDRRALAEGWVVMEYLNYVLGRFSAALDCAMNAVRAAETANRAREMWQAGGDMGLVSVWRTSGSRKSSERHRVVCR